MKPNNNGLWAGLIVEELVRHGCTMFFISPGSRSSPLVAEIGRHAATDSCVHVDERGSAFAALGYARVSMQPVAWVTTSGTAVANGLPAVIEASLDGIPLILLTADRPPELRETMSNQTIRQSGIFGAYVRWQFDMPAPSASIDPAFVLTTVDHAVFRACEEKGPVHLNCVFREPLETEAQRLEDEISDAHISTWFLSKKPYKRHFLGTRKATEEETEAFNRLLSEAKRPVILLGRTQSDEYVQAAVSWAEHAQVPVFPDILSGFRLGKQSSCLINHHDLCPLAPNLVAGLSPDLVVQIGKPPVSKRMQLFLKDISPGARILIDNGVARVDPEHRVSHRYMLDTEGMKLLFEELTLPTWLEADWLGRWRSLSAQADKLLSRILADDSGRSFSEQAIARQLCSLLPDNHQLVLASSLPIRHVDSFAASTDAFVRVISNRGASGIDGTIATASGAQQAASASRAASAQSRPARTTVFIGDLALLHDLNSLSLAVQSNLTIVVINNDGGGIFSYLPIAEKTDVFEPFFGTPHGFSFEAAAQMFGLTYRHPTDPGSFESDFMESLERPGTTIIEVTADRAQTKTTNDHLIGRLGKALQWKSTNQADTA